MCPDQGYVARGQSTRHLGLVTPDSVLNDPYLYGCLMQYFLPLENIKVRDKQDYGRFKDHWWVSITAPPPPIPPSLNYPNSAVWFTQRNIYMNQLLTTETLHYKFILYLALIFRLLQDIVGTITVNSRSKKYRRYKILLRRHMKFAVTFFPS